MHPTPLWGYTRNLNQVRYHPNNSNLGRPLSESMETTTYLTLNKNETKYQLVQKWDMYLFSYAPERHINDINWHSNDTWSA